VAAVFGWQYRNISYLLPMVPALAILATAYGPLFSKRMAPWMLALLGAAFVAKAVAPAAPWGLSFERGTVQADAPLLSGYCQRARANELIVVGMDDDLYASTLPLAKLRYCLVGANLAGGRYGMDFGGMGSFSRPRSSTASPNGNRYSGSACGSGDWIPANPSGRSF